ncbi:sulfatase-like hydrolase/transferase [uncultured Bacteroides sp.]|uniref:sulfatase-like hydrolase/transferase n=1 Tax=uncultured Bacteroides sp. TaxID=162156 RepID=UPI0025D1963B|nr:sulfatase-like hydrolase/transferase [uncultured Bacteroides sp.]
MKKYGIATISCLTFINVFAQNEKKLNILFIEADQHRYDCTGFSGKGLVKTPNIDKLAEEGVVFENSYSCIPTSCPARQCLLSGQWPEKHRGLWNYDITLPITPFEGPTWTEKLSQEDVRMGYVGKWHVSDKKSPKDFGFQDYVNEWSYNGWRKWKKLPDYVWEDKKWVMGGYDPVNKEHSRTHWLAQNVINLIKKYNSENKPWYIRFETSDPHLPCYPVKEFLDMYDKSSIKEWGNFRDKLHNKPYIQRLQVYNWELEDAKWEMWQGYLQRYFANITQLDDAIGIVINTLKELGIYDNTIIIYTSDHGDAGGCHNMVDKHYVMYEEVTHVPLVIKMPGVEHHVVNEFINNQLDMAAFMCDYYNLEYKTQGESLMPLIKNETTTWRKYAFSNYNGQQFGLFVQRMVRDKKMKYVWNLTDIDELYDLEKDPWELHNLIYDKKYQSELVRLRKVLYEDLKKRQDPLVRQDAAKRQLIDNVKL